ncbi:unnamed protein product [Lymnaea stagnalis]|uniref:Sulfatase N-terminal domain-containing protein n=1 Tax=Lymnaea stagnalis TaxID=6523 RepID=A0AAV2HZB8_LYMST
MWRGQDMCLILLLACMGSGWAKPPKPHIVFIVADDLGMNDVGYNNPDIISPNIDSLARSGIILNQSYLQPLCSPSRAAFITGTYPFKLGLQHIVIDRQQPVCVPLNKTVLPQVLRDNGYATHMVGKWHQGFCKWECTPTFRGFDTFFGYYNGQEDYYQKKVDTGFDFRFNTSVGNAAVGNYSTEQFATRVEEIIFNHNTDTPLYVYLPFQSVHTPLQVPEKYLALYPNITNTKRRALSAMVTAMDDAVGRVVTALKKRHLYENTLIFFTSDNGGSTPNGGNNYPLRGGKATIFEGGTRVPAFLHGSILKNSGSVYNGMIHAVDWFATLLRAVNINYDDPDQDGVNQWEAINTLGVSKRSEFVYNLDYHPLPIEGRSGIRVGDYKLIEGFPGIYQRWYKPDGLDQGPNFPTDILSNPNPNPDPDGLDQGPNFPTDIWSTHDWTHPLPNITQVVHGQLFKYLFHLKNDPNEHKNLYYQLPDVVKQLQDRLYEYKKKYVTPNYPPNDPSADPSNYGGVWTPGWC